MSYILSDGTPVTKETPEDVIQADVLLRLSKEFMHQLTAWRNNAGALPVEDRYIRFGIPGQADISGLTKLGNRLEIEIKRLGKKQSKPQIKFEKMITSHNGIYLLCDGDYENQVKKPLIRFLTKGSINDPD